MMAIQAPGSAPGRLLGPPRWLLGMVAAAALLAACDESGGGGGGGGGASGIDTLGSDFVRAFNQDPNDTPLDASELTLTLTPRIEPFDP